MFSNCRVEKTIRMGMPGPVPPNSALFPEMPHRLTSTSRTRSGFLEVPAGDIFINYSPRQTPVVAEALLFA